MKSVPLYSVDSSCRIFFKKTLIGKMIKELFEWVIVKIYLGICLYQLLHNN